MRTTRKPKYDIENIFPELAQYRKNTIRLHPIRITESAEFVQLVTGEAIWGEHQLHYIPIFQILKTDFSEVDFPDENDVLNIFWCPKDHGEVLEPQFKAIWGKSARLNNSNHIISLNPEAVIEYPSLEKLLSINEPLGRSLMEWQSRKGEENEEEEAIYEYQLSVADGTKIGGYVNWVQSDETPNCECNNEMEHLLTVSEAEFDGGTYGRWCPIELEDVWKLPYKERVNLQSPLGLSLGDMGKIYFFICEKCKSKPLRIIYQCS
ncbi:hypothetical protein GC102_20935 [Paenibacillus sp. LMG 31460]|uniref:DUF1963 domain-containing protein n=1 Tax=Paenibacillus germinis TaxID=2654979 RepID=A0ABX1Z4A8_9BACL|nr:DUF1963 domain-containing protein [Paenibacillus germinis]NOU88215.1 hypothetical protein [Paenibacillus germinis]